LKRPTIILVTMVTITAGRVSAQCVSENSPYGINAHAPQGSDLALQLDEVQACGIGWIRVDFVWSWVEPSQDSFTWTIYDAIVAAADARGLHIYATIGNTPAWATSGSPGTGAPNSAADFYDVCFRAAQRYAGSIKYWGMWNEPNLSQFWAGTRGQYIDLILKNGADAVHAAASDLKACGPELAHLSSGNWDAWLTDCINQAGSKLDVVTHHGYSGSGYSNVTDKLDKAPVWPWDPPCVKQILQNTGWFGRPFWLTETGWESASVGETNQASYYTGLLNDWFTGRPARSWVSKVFFYELSDSQSFPDISFGILGPEPAHTPKPAFTAYQAFVTAHPSPPVPPAKAAGPVPAPLATKVNVNADLTWSPASCATSYDVYFGTTSPGTFRGNQAASSFNPGPLARYTTYYWRIDTLNGVATTTGDVWWFTTAGVQADFDDDIDVDQTDFGHFQECLSGKGQFYSPGCEACDFDGDSDVDDDDFAAFRLCLSGPNQFPGC
jgi:polysaccharide biosynthesis protein PslG